MHRLAVVIFLLSSLLVQGIAHADPDYRAMERGIVEESNRARRDPTAFARLLRERLPRFRGRVYEDESGARIRTAEGRRAVKEAIAWLESAQPAEPLDVAPALTRAARVHADSQRDGAVGHVGADGSQPHERVSRFGRWHVLTGENIFYGGMSATDVVAGLIVDDGVADRGHRAALFTDRFTVTGVACGPHERYETVCVIEYAVELEAAPAVASR